MNIFVDSRSITLESARHVVDHAVASAKEQGLAICAAVVDRAGHLVSYDRMERAPLLCAQLAQDKAYTVASFGLPTHEWWDIIRDQPVLLHGLIKTDRLIVMGGGAPIIHDNELIGAVGISGGSADQDRALAERAAQSLIGQCS
jgi:glc operon protein GlcG